MRKNEILIIGSGFSGAVLARELSENTNLPVTVIEKRPVVGGNMYDEFDKNGILIQKYGPHIVFTDDYEVIEYLSLFDEMVPHDCKMLSYIDGKFVQLPYGFKTVQQLYPLKQAARIIEKLKAVFPEKKSVTIYELMQSEDFVIREFGHSLFEKGFRPYIAKQWNKSLDEIDADVINRVQFQLSYVERYLQKDYQFLPKHGFTYLISRMLSSKRISLVLGCDALNDISFTSDKILFKGDEYRYVFFTGAVDELFSCSFGPLPYRSLVFKYDYFSADRVLPCEICSFPKKGKYTRKTEYKFFSPFTCNSSKTVVVTEYPVDYDKDSSVGNVHCYPIINDENVALYKRYLDHSQKFSNLHLIGRLANYEYINMDTAIKRALLLSKNIIAEIGGEK